MAKNDGGFVFPSGRYNSETGHEDWPIRDGMTRRQLYGLGAMIGVLAADTAGEDKKTAMREAWDWADALLATEEELDEHD